jgi:hypothetical protein
VLSRLLRGLRYHQTHIESAVLDRVSQERVGQSARCHDTCTNAMIGGSDVHLIYWRNTTKREGNSTHLKFKVDGVFF